MYSWRRGALSRTSRKFSCFPQKKVESVLLDVAFSVGERNLLGE